MKEDARELHFDFRDGDWMYLETPGGMDRATALEQQGWKLLGGWVLTRGER